MILKAKATGKKKGLEEDDDFKIDEDFKEFDSIGGGDDDFDDDDDF
jgi:nucleolin